MDVGILLRYKANCAYLGNPRPQMTQNDADFLWVGSCCACSCGLMRTPLAVSTSGETLTVLICVFLR